MRHAGINTEKVRAYYTPRWSDRKVPARFWNNFLGFQREDTTWNGMRANNDPNQKHFYKSHTVVPITYRKHATTEKMNREFGEVLQIGDRGRAILGLICVDHPSAYYFDNADPDLDRNVDVNTLMQFADLLSLAFVSKRMFFEGSASVQRYLRLKDPSVNGGPVDDNGDNDDDNFLGGVN